MVTQHRNEATTSSANTTFGGQPNTRGVSPAAPAAPVAVGVSGGVLQEDHRQRNDHDGREHAVGHHGGPPAEDGDRALEDRRPDRAGEIEPARQQRERRAAAAVEPVADIDIERRVEAGGAEQADEDAVAEIELPEFAEGRNPEPDADRHGAEDHRLADAVARRQRPHHQAAERASEPGERACQRRLRARAAEIGGHRLQADRHDPQRAERHREHHERHARDHPGGSRLDAWK